MSQWTVCLCIERIKSGLEWPMNEDLVREWERERKGKRMRMSSWTQGYSLFGSRQWWTMTLKTLKVKPANKISINHRHRFTQIGSHCRSVANSNTFSISCNRFQLATLIDWQCSIDCWKRWGWLPNLSYYLCGSCLSCISWYSNKIDFRLSSVITFTVFVLKTDRRNEWCNLVMVQLRQHHHHEHHHHHHWQRHIDRIAGANMLTTTQLIVSEWSLSNRQNIYQKVNTQLDHWSRLQWMDECSLMCLL